MTASQVGDINRERLRRWARKLGVGHDHNSGTVVVCVTEDMPDEMIRAFLRKALADLGG